MKSAIKEEAGQTGRRDFIAAATALSAGAAWSNVTGALVLPLPSRPLPSALGGHAARNASAFRTHLLSDFSITALSASAAPQAVKLVAVAPLAHAHPDLNAEQCRELAFSITLASSQHGWAQDTYALSHPVLGDFAALLVPSRDGRELTGVFHLAA